MHYLRCFMCNLLLKQKDKSHNSISSSLVVKILKTVWKFPDFTLLNDGANTKPVTSCKKCVAKLKRISKTYFQLQTLQKLLIDLQSEIETSVGKCADDTASSESSLVKVFKKVDDKVDDKDFSRHDDEYLRNGKELRSTILRGLSVLKEQSEHKCSFCTSSSTVETQTVRDENNEESETLKNELGCIISGKLISEENNIITGINCVVEERSQLKSNPANRNESSFSQDDDDHAYEDPSSPNFIRERLPCERCNSTFKDEIGKWAHWRKRHEGDKYCYHCQNCAKRFATRKQYRIHVMCHTQETPFICEHCGKGFRLEKLLLFHVKNKHTSEPRDFKCTAPSCTWGFTTLAKLKAHQTTHSSTKVPCTICNKSFSSTTALNVHLVQHSDSNPWKCSICERAFSCHSALKNHVALHNKSFKFQCDLCPFGGQSKSVLERHMVSHRSDKQFRCGICKNEFKYKKSLSKHLKVHAGLKSHCCPTCGKLFIDNYKLQRHAKIHEGIRPFICDFDGGECDRSFYTNDALQAHKKSHNNNTTGSAKNHSEPKSSRKSNNKPSSASAIMKSHEQEAHEAQSHEASIIMLIGNEEVVDAEDDSLALPSQIPMTMQFMPMQNNPYHSQPPLSHHEEMQHEIHVSGGNDVVMGENDMITQNMISDSHPLPSNGALQLEPSTNVFPGGIFQFHYLAP